MTRKIYHFDEDYIKQAKEKGKLEEKDMNLIYKNYYKLIYSGIFAIIKNKEITEELTNDVFLKAFESFELYTEDISFRAWLRKIAKNKAIDYIRSEKNTPYSLEMDNEDTGFKNSYTDNYTVEDELIQINNKLTLKDLYKSLRYTERQLFDLRYKQELQYEDIAKMLNVTVGTIKSRLYNIKEKLKKLRNKHEKCN